MDKASAYGAEDSRFDPWCGRIDLLHAIKVDYIDRFWAALSDMPQVPYSMTSQKHEGV